MSLVSPLAMEPFPFPSLPTSVAGRMETIAAWFEGFPVYAECACGCGELTDTGRREPVITKAQAAKLMEGM